MKGSGRGGPAPTKKDLIKRLRNELYAHIDTLLNKFRDSVNEAIEANQKRLYKNHMIVAQVVDASNDRGNALTELLLEKGIFTEDELNAAVAAAQAKRIAEVEQVRAERAKEREEVLAKMEEQREAAEKAALAEATEQKTVVDAASDPIASGPARPTGNHPPEVTVFGG